MARCTWDGYAYYTGELRAITTQYSKVLMLGDSMGGSAALMFSPLASRVVSFVPQVELLGYSQATREDLTAERCRAFQTRLLQSVADTAATVTVHIGADEEDSRHAGMLSTGETGRVQIVVHPECPDHHLSGRLKTAGRLVEIVRSELKAMGVARMY